jgi:hypothetical protein
MLSTTSVSTSVTGLHVSYIAHSSGHNRAITYESSSNSGASLTPVQSSTLKGADISLWIPAVLDAWIIVLHLLIWLHFPQRPAFILTETRLIILELTMW